MGYRGDTEKGFARCTHQATPDFTFHGLALPNLHASCRPGPSLGPPQAHGSAARKKDDWPSSQGHLKATGDRRASAPCADRACRQSSAASVARHVRHHD
jgi:hypothetical protein